MMNVKTLLSLYKRNKITKNGLKNAVKDKVITQEQYIEIVSVDNV